MAPSAPGSPIEPYKQQMKEAYYLPYNIQQPLNVSLL